MDYLDKQKAIDYLEKIEKETRDQFERIKQENYNANTKGFDLEETLADFYSSYLSEGYNFFIRQPILDINLKVEEILKRINEFDVIATYKNAIPRLIYKIKRREFIPYDSVAFITEVKQTLTKPFLKKDLEKFQKLNNLKIGSQFKYLNFPYTRPRPERVLFYYERKASQSGIVDLLKQYQDSWDVMTILKDDVIFINDSNYTSKNIMKRSGWGHEKGYPLLKTMLYATYPSPNLVNSWDLIIINCRS